MRKSIALPVKIKEGIPSLKHPIPVKVNEYYIKVFRL
jgi:hypothetical protein